MDKTCDACGGITTELKKCKNHNTGKDKKICVYCYYSTDDMFVSFNDLPYLSLMRHINNMMNILERRLKRRTK